MLGGLTIFLLICAGLALFAQWLIFESPTEMDVTLKVGRGTVGLAERNTSGEQAIRSSASVADGDTFTTDSLSQGYLTFADPYSGDTVATVTLRENSSAGLGRANRPRFSLSTNPYSLRLDDVSGQIEVWVSDGLDREVRLVITSPLGMLRINEPGNFLLESSPTQFIATARQGRATLETESAPPQLVAASYQGIIQQDMQTVHIQSSPEELLPNWDFSQSDNWPVEWVCSFEPSPDYPNAPSARRDFIREDGRAIAHISRYLSAPEPGKFLCYQDLNISLKTQQYDDLRLRVTLQIRHQSLTGCGQAGSECPLLLRMDYRDASGNEFTWYHGFYAEPAGPGARTICDSCLEEHERINKGVWYSYESGNLLEILPEDRRLAEITRLTFIADGHEYDVVLNEVALVGIGVARSDAQAAIE